MNSKSPQDAPSEADLPRASSADGSGDPFQEQVGKLLGLLQAQSRGEKCSAEIEAALSSLVPKPSSDVLQIQPDDTNYDTFDDTDHKKPVAEEFSTGRKATMESLRQQDAEMERARRKNNPCYMSEQWNELEDIPLGIAGAKMMVTFGDGQNPKPAAVAAALMGTRTCLQYAIKDARALRRKQKHEFIKARMATALQTRKDDKEKFGESAVVHQNVDPFMVFRAVSGYDPLSFESKVGFDVSQLDVLFPEEMNAYKKWEKMRHDYEVSKKSDRAKVEEGAEDDKGAHDVSPKDSNVKDSEEEGSGGHLRGRLAQFDARTARMKEDWYMTFSEVRQGSFLHSKFRTEEEKQWNVEKKKRTKRGRSETTWETLSATSVQFLHWLGFDQNSALPPPNEEITQALAFLGYDFFGKIVEKAIFLRLQKRAEQHTASDAAVGSGILEMQDGEQLDAEDIERALNDASINSMPLYSAANSVLGGPAGHAMQLYFGPGFEDRLEMEMEQLLGRQETDLPEEELQVRKQEDELFSKLTSQLPTKLAGVSDVLGDEHVTDEIIEQREKSKKRQAAYRERISKAKRKSS